MSIRRVQKSDWPEFYELASKEGWRVPAIERKLFEGHWSEFAHVFDDGSFCGLVTAVAHESSGWIGNLIVPQALRGQGFGSRLFRAALSDLEARGVSACWLTASADGQPLYEKAGFVVVDQIERWVCTRPPGSGQAGGISLTGLEKLFASDRTAWGESRTELLTQISKNGQLLVSDDTVALLQQGDDLQILGPWYSPTLCPRANRQLLQQALIAADPSKELVVDLFASSPLRSLLVATGFELFGRNQLMVKADANRVNRQGMVALASLGSFG